MIRMTCRKSAFRERRVIHDLQQDAEHVRMRLLDFVEQQHGVGRLANRVDQQAALFVADVAGRRADQP
jgi:peptide deformylase